MTPSSSSSSSDQDPAGAHRAATRGRLLVVDDQPQNIQVVGTILGRLGHEIVPASDGATALKRLGLKPPDLILLDLLMPGMDGYEVCRRIRQNPEWNDIPIIFLSAASDKDYVVRALEAGSVDYITKPFNQAELVSRVRTQLELKAARDRLRELVEDKDELIGLMAHDCKNQLGGLHMTAQLLRQRTASSDDKKLRQMAEAIEQASDRLLGFVKEFLANASAEHALQFKSHPVDLAELARHSVDTYGRAARRKDLRIDLELPSEPAVVESDRSALEQILGNLLSNAVKFSPPGRTIAVRVERAGDGFALSVADQGPGFTEEDKARLFRRYTRLSAKPTGGEPSTGLGLSIVKKLVDALGGSVSCESPGGKGACFVVRLASQTNAIKE